MTMEQYALQVENLIKDYGSFKLKNVSFGLPKGYIMGLIGPNGAGKSTTISMLLGRVRPQSGKAMIFGQETETLPDDLKAKIGVVLDECNFAPVLTWPQVDKFMGGLYPRWDSARFSDKCRRAGLDPKKKIRTYSKGMKMKLSLAAATCHGATLLILDEATSGLDPLAREDVLDMLLDFVSDGEHSVLVSSHILSDLEKVCDYITFINDGRVVFSREKDYLHEKYGILRCSNQEFTALDGAGIISHRTTEFGTERLVVRDMIPSGYIVEKAEIEDIMIFWARRDKR